MPVIDGPRSSAAQAWAAGFVCVTLAACSGRATLKDDAANVADAQDGGNDDTIAVAAGPDVAKDVGAAYVDAPGTMDLPREVSWRDGPLCPTESDHGALTPSAPACAITPVAVDAPSLCSGAATCPVGAMFALNCAGGGYGPWVVPTAAGASVMFVTNTGGFVTRLFSLVPGAAARVDDVPALTAAANALSVDSDGNPTIFAGEMPGIWRVRKTALGWRREVAVEDGQDLALVKDARAIDANRAFVVYNSVNDQLPRIAVRDGSCWSRYVLPGTVSAGMGLDVDGLNRPWVAWFGHAGGQPVALDLAGPDGPHRVWTSSVADALSGFDRPAVVAGGFAGTAAYPTLVMQRRDGVHLLIPDATAPRWTDRLLAGSAAATRTDDCPPERLALAACGGRTTCTTTTKGAMGGYGVARTTAGRAYAAWFVADGGTTYALSPGAPTSGCPNPAGLALCMCSKSPAASYGTGTIVIARVDTASPTEALRLTFGTDGELRGSVLAMASRGNTLLLVASLGIGLDTALRYLEVDTAQLP